VYLIYSRLQTPGVQLARAAAVKGRCVEGRSLADAPRHGRQLVLRQGEDDRDRLQLGYDDDAVRITRLDVIAGVNLAQPDAAGDRRDDTAIGQVQLLGVDLRLIGLHDRRLLLHRRRLSIQGLAGDRVLCDERLIALQIDLGVFQRRLILGQLRL